MTAPVPGPQPLAGYRLRDYDDLIATLALSRESQRITYAEIAKRIGNCYLQQVFNWLRGVEARGRRVFDLAGALGYDLALIPRAEPKPEHVSEDCYCTDTYTDPWCKPRETAPETAPASTHSASRPPGVAGTANEALNDSDGFCDGRACTHTAEGAQTSTGDDT